jgi:hypothetical protein
MAEPTAAGTQQATPAHVLERNGTGYVSAAEALERAPTDCVEQDVEGVFGGKVRVRGLTAAQNARVKQESINLSGRKPDVVWAAMERLQFELGVIEPKFTADQVRTLHLTAGPSFAKVIAAIDALSGTSEEERRKAQEAFQGPNE